MELRRPFPQQPFDHKEVERLLSEQGKSLKDLARALGISKGYLSKALRHVDRKQLSVRQMEEAAVFLEKSVADYPELRRAAVIELLDDRPGLRDALFAKYVNAESIDENAQIRLRVRRGEIS